MTGQLSLGWFWFWSNQCCTYLCIQDLQRTGWHIWEKGGQSPYSLVRGLGKRLLLSWPSGPRMCLSLTWDFSISLLIMSQMDPGEPREPCAGHLFWPTASGLRTHDHLWWKWVMGWRLKENKAKSLYGFRKKINIAQVIAYALLRTESWSSGKLWNSMTRMARDTVPFLGLWPLFLCCVEPLWCCYHLSKRVISTSWEESLLCPFIRRAWRSGIKDESTYHSCRILGFHPRSGFWTLLSMAFSLLKEKQPSMDGPHSYI